MQATHGLSLAGALALAVSLGGAAHAEQGQGPGPAPGQGQAQGQGGAPSGTFGAVTPQTKTRVVVIGENNVVRKLDKAGGQAVSNSEIFRVAWSPVGAGTVCVVSVSGHTNPSDSFGLAIYDNKAVYDYVIKEVRTDYAAYTPAFGTITQRDSMAGGFSRTETCRTPTRTIDLVWTHLKVPNFIDISMFNNTVQMALNIIPASSGDIVVDGTSAPGTWYEQGGGFGTGAYLALGETWRR
jgi:hypothetical protein